jgi:hypothetical protein
MQAQTDALGDFVLNLALRHPEYERDYHLLQKTFGHSRYLLLVSLEKKDHEKTWKLARILGNARALFLCAI